MIRDAPTKQYTHRQAVTVLVLFTCNITTPYYIYFYCKWQGYQNNQLLPFQDE